MELALLDQRILATIDELRAEHHACTATAVAATLRMAKSYISTRIKILGAHGLVEFTDMPGSLRVVVPEAGDAAVRADEGDPAGTVVADDRVLEASTPAAAPARAPRQAAKKAGASKGVAADVKRRHQSSKSSTGKRAGSANTRSKAGT